MPQNAPDPNPTNLHKLTNTACPRKRKCRSRFPSFCPLRFLAFIASSYARLFQLLQASLVAPSLSQSDLPKLRKKATNNSKGWPPILGVQKSTSSRARKRELPSIRTVWKREGFPRVYIDTVLRYLVTHTPAPPFCWRWCAEPSNWIMYSTAMLSIPSINMSPGPGCIMPVTEYGDFRKWHIEGPQVTQ